MADTIKLIVGLGNPTSRYEKTRHNAGFWFLDGVSGRTQVSLREESRFQGAFGRDDRGGGPLFLLKPSTYMNRSGASVGAVAAYFKIAPEEILVAHDELDLPPGVVRLKRGGGHGGHNGLRDLLAHLKSPDFLRLRLGIGHPGDRLAVANYVLDAPSKEDLGLIEESMADALRELDSLRVGDVAGVMSRLNGIDRRQLK